MGNILGKVKEITKNKNTVTILIVLIGIFALYFVYNHIVSLATEPIMIPYATTTLPSRHVITSDDVSFIEVAGGVLNNMDGIIKDSGLVIGQEVAYGNTIQKNSFFFEDSIADSKTNASASDIIGNLENGYTPIYLSVDLNSTFGNAIYPGNYIDLWFEGEDNSGNFIYGKYISSIKVLDVQDDMGASVFESGSEAREPSQLLFGVPSDMRLKIDTALKVGRIVPVPRNRSFTEHPEATKIANSYLDDFILSKAAYVPSNVSSGNVESEND
ncbi:MAG: hypothetical protein IJ743_04325 [Bacilli bacterium]|nr:hypothetical protein [Bacilli bacterium]